MSDIIYFENYQWPMSLKLIDRGQHGLVILATHPKRWAVIPVLLTKETDQSNHYLNDT